MTDLIPLFEEVIDTEVSNKIKYFIFKKLVCGNAHINKIYSIKNVTYTEFIEKTGDKLINIKQFEAVKNDIIKEVRKSFYNKLKNAKSDLKILSNYKSVIDITAPFIVFNNSKRKPDIYVGIGKAGEYPHRKIILTSENGLCRTFNPDSNKIEYSKNSLDAYIKRNIISKKNINRDAIFNFAEDFFKSRNISGYLRANNINNEKERISGLRVYLNLDTKDDRIKKNLLNLSGRIIIEYRKHMPSNKESIVIIKDDENTVIKKFNDAASFDSVLQFYPNDNKKKLNKEFIKNSKNTFKEKEKILQSVYDFLDKERKHLTYSGSIITAATLTLYHIDEIINFSDSYNILSRDQFTVENVSKKFFSLMEDAKNIFKSSGKIILNLKSINQEEEPININLNMIYNIDINLIKKENQLLFEFISSSSLGPNYLSNLIYEKLEDFLKKNLSFYGEEKLYFKSLKEIKNKINNDISNIKDMYNKSKVPSEENTLFDSENNRKYHVSIVKNVSLKENKIPSLTNVKEEYYIRFLEKYILDKFLEKERPSSITTIKFSDLTKDIYYRDVINDDKKNDEKINEYEFTPNVFSIIKNKAIKRLYKKLVIDKIISSRDDVQILKSFKRDDLIIRPMLIVSDSNQEDREVCLAIARIKNYGEFGSLYILPSSNGKAVYKYSSYEDCQTYKSDLSLEKKLNKIFSNKKQSGDDLVKELKERNFKISYLDGEILARKNLAPINIKQKNDIFKPGAVLEISYKRFKRDSQKVTLKVINFDKTNGNSRTKEFKISTDLTFLDKYLKFFDKEKEYRLMDKYYKKQKLNENGSIEENINYLLETLNNSK